MVDKTAFFVHEAPVVSFVFILSVSGLNVHIFLTSGVGRSPNNSFNNPQQLVSVSLVAFEFIIVMLKVYHEVAF